MTMRIGTIAALAAALALAGCGPAPAERRATTRAAPTPQAIAQRIGIALPASARIDHAEWTSGLDDAAWLVVILPEADWAVLRGRIAARAKQEPEFATDTNLLLGSPHDGWQPAAAAGLRTAQLPWADGVEALNVGVAPAPGGAVRLFLFWHQL